MKTNSGKEKYNFLLQKFTRAEGQEAMKFILLNRREVCVFVRISAGETASQHET